MDDEKPSPFADLVTGAAWLALAVAIMIGAWSMDRLERLSAKFYTAPGLVPGILGAALALMALLLMRRGIRAGAFAGMALPRIRLAEHWRLIVALVLCLGFAVGLVGRGLPFWVAAAIYTALMVLVFEAEDRRRDGQRLRGVAVAVVFGIVSALAIQGLFQHVFLVRLP